MADKTSQAGVGTGNRRDGEDGLESDEFVLIVHDLADGADVFPVEFSFDV